MDEEIEVRPTDLEDIDNSLNDIKNLLFDIRKSLRILSNRQNEEPVDLE